MSLPHRIPLSCAALRPAQSFIICQNRPSSSQSAAQDKTSEEEDTNKEAKPGNNEPRLSQEVLPIPSVHSEKFEIEKSQLAEGMLSKVLHAAFFKFLLLFTQISTAQALEPVQKRRFFDLQAKIAPRPWSTLGLPPAQQSMSALEKNVTDMGIDYKDFEHKRRKNRYFITHIFIFMDFYFFEFKIFGR
jgi:hypothetical protein